MDIEEVARAIDVEPDSTVARHAEVVFSRYEDIIKHLQVDNVELKKHLDVLLKLTHIFANRYIEQIESRSHTEVMKDIKTIFHDNHIDWNIYSPVIFVPPKNDVVVQEGGRSDVEKRLNNVGN